MTSESENAEIHELLSNQATHVETAPELLKDVKQKHRSIKRKRNTLKGSFAMVALAAAIAIPFLAFDRGKETTTIANIPEEQRSNSSEKQLDDSFSLTMFWDGTRLAALDEGSPRNPETMQYSGSYYSWDSQRKGWFEQTDPTFTSAVAPLHICPNNFNCPSSHSEDVPQLPLHYASTTLQPEAATETHLVFARYIGYNMLKETDEGTPFRTIHPDALDILSEGNSCFQELGNTKPETNESAYISQSGSDPSSATMTCTKGTENYKKSIDFNDHFNEKELNTMHRNGGVSDLWVMTPESELQKIENPPTHSYIHSHKNVTAVSSVFSDGTYFWAENQGTVNRSINGTDWEEINVLSEEYSNLGSIKAATGGYVAIEICKDESHDAKCIGLHSSDSGTSWSKGVDLEGGYIKAVGPAGFAVKTEEADNKVSYHLITTNTENLREISSQHTLRSNSPEVVVGAEGMIIKSYTPIRSKKNPEAVVDHAITYSQVNVKQ